MIGEILSYGYGDRVVIGMIFGAIENISPIKLYNYIVDNISLSDKISDDDLEHLRTITKYVESGDIIAKRVMDELRENRLDLSGVIVNTPGGVEWIEQQIKTVKSRLGV